MQHDYELQRECFTTATNSFDTCCVLVLSRAGEKNFLQEMAEDKKTRHDAALITAAVKRLICMTTDIAIRTQLIKPIRGIHSLFVVEIRPNPRKSVVRVMAYLHQASTARAVLLFAFKGHRGMKKGIPKEVLEQAERLALFAKELIEESGVF